jgi:branched-subunit amino acid aminotransferase/4-amino-4-deoxychorismate lyase
MRLEELAGPLLERVVPRAGLAGRSLFLTNAVRGVVPVARLDGVEVPQDPRTAVLAARFWP